MGLNWECKCWTFTLILCCVGPLPVLNVQLQLDLEEFLIVVKSGNRVICANVNEDDTVFFS